MLVIRLARTGRTKYPTYRIVAAESARATTGRFVEVLGHYNPHTKELVIKREQTEKRLSHGAQPSNSVIKLLMREKVVLPDWVKLKTKAPKTTAAPSEEPAEEPAEPAATAEVAEASETRVAAVAEETVSETTAGIESDPDKTETAASEAVQTEAAQEGAEAAAEANTPKAGK